MWNFIKGLFSSKQLKENIYQFICIKLDDLKGLSKERLDAEVEKLKLEIKSKLGI